MGLNNYFNITLYCSSKMSKLKSCPDRVINFSSFSVSTPSDNVNAPSHVCLGALICLLLRFNFGKALEKTKPVYVSFVL